jgi:hypothetical protein
MAGPTRQYHGVVVRDATSYVVMNRDGNGYSKPEYPMGFTRYEGSMDDFSTCGYINGQEPLPVR